MVRPRKLPHPPPSRPAPPPPAARADQLLAALGELSADDLAAVDARIAERRAELAGLENVRRVIAAKLGPAAPAPDPAGGTAPRRGRPPGRKPGPKPAAAPAPEPAVPAYPEADLAPWRKKAARLLADRGPLAPTRVADECGFPAPAVSAVLTHPWFEFDLTRGTYRATSLARRELLL